MANWFDYNRSIAHAAYGPWHGFYPIYGFQDESGFIYSLPSYRGSRGVPVIGDPYRLPSQNTRRLTNRHRTNTSSAYTGPVDHGIPTASRVSLLAQQSASGRYGQASQVIHSVDDLEILMTKATHFIDGRCSWYTVPCFYRDKTSKYFNNILRNEAGLMKVYTKDFHGDPKSPINGRLDGLFFSVNINPKTGAPPMQSIYGEKRLEIGIDVILDLCPNLYFTDFYCISRPHYVTLVLTLSGSSADQFCRRHLVKLSWQDNPFLRLSEDAGSRRVLRVRQSSDFFIELMVTENLNISGQTLRSVTMVGNRSGGRLGLKKKTSCSICNINRPVSSASTPFLFH